MTLAVLWPLGGDFWSNAMLKKGVFPKCISVRMTKRYLLFVHTRVIKKLQFVVDFWSKAVFKKEVFPKCLKRKIDEALFSIFSRKVSQEIDICARFLVKSCV